MQFVGITEQEARSAKFIGHKSGRVFENACTRIGNVVEEINDAVATAPEMQFFAPLVTPSLSQIATTIHEIALGFQTTDAELDAHRDLSLAELKERIQQIDELEAELQEVGKEPADVESRDTAFTAEEVASLKNEVHTLLDSLYAHMPDHRQEAEKNLESLIDLLNDPNYLQKVIRVMCDFIGAASGFISLSTIMQPHAIRSRYPSGDFDPLEFYTRERPLVRTLPALYRIACRSMDRLYNLSAAVPPQGEEE